MLNNTFEMRSTFQIGNSVFEKSILISSILIYDSLHLKFKVILYVILITKNRNYIIKLKFIKNYIKCLKKI